MNPTCHTQSMCMVAVCTVLVNSGGVGSVIAIMSCSSAWTAVNEHTHSRDIVTLTPIVWDKNIYRKQKIASYYNGQ